MFIFLVILKGYVLFKLHEQVGDFIWKCLSLPVYCILRFPFQPKVVKSGKFMHISSDDWQILAIMFQCNMGSLNDDWHGARVGCLWLYLAQHTVLLVKYFLPDIIHISLPGSISMANILFKVNKYLLIKLPYLPKWLKYVVLLENLPTFWFPLSEQNVT